MTPRFVIQKHASRTLHYDLRLEAAGVLKSWAIPKGPSTDPREKRLAMEVEDYSLGYGDFEGRIGAGYGEGAVIVWDEGTYEPLTAGPVGEALANGHLSFWLEGHKLHAARVGQDRPDHRPGLKKGVAPPRSAVERGERSRRGLGGEPHSDGSPFRSQRPS